MTYPQQPNGGQWPTGPGQQGPWDPQHPAAPQPGAPYYPGQEYPAAQYPGAQYPGAQYPQGQYPGTEYPQGQYPQGLYPGAQYPQGQYPPQYPGYPPAQYPTPQPGWGQQPPGGWGPGGPPFANPNGGKPKTGLLVGLGAAIVLVVVAIVVAVFAFGHGDGKSSLADLSKDQLKELLPTPGQYPTGFTKDKSLDDQPNPKGVDDFKSKLKTKVTPAECEKMGSGLLGGTSAARTDKSVILSLTKTGSNKYSTDSILAGITSAGFETSLSDLKKLVSQCGKTTRTTTFSDSADLTFTTECTDSLVDAPASSVDEAVAIRESCKDRLSSTKSDGTSIDALVYLANTRGLSVMVAGAPNYKDAVDQTYGAVTKNIDNK